MTWQDTVLVVYQGPPRWTGRRWVNGDRFTLSGFPTEERILNGVELAPGLNGLDRGPEEYRIETGANTPGGDLVAVSTGRREISGQINIMGKTPAEFRENYQRWWRNHPEKEKGRLWFYTRNGEPRYLSVVKSESAGVGAQERDPNVRSLAAQMPWGWVSDHPYFYGYRCRQDLKYIYRTTGHYKAVFYNPSTVPEVYPDLYLPGGGAFTFSLGYNQPDYRTPMIPRGAELKISFDPRKRTCVQKNADGSYTNLWHTMLGRRPRLSFEPETKNTFPLIWFESAGDGKGLDFDPYIVFTPEFTSWI